MNPYEKKLREMMATFVEEVFSTNDPDVVLSVACAMEDIARDVRKRRLDMVYSPEFRCYECGRHWTTEMTVQKEQNYRPDICPECYNKSKPGNKSIYTDEFRYVSKTKEND